MKTAKEEIKNEIVELLFDKLWATSSVYKHISKKHKLGKTRTYELIKEAKKESGEAYEKMSEKVLENTITKLEKLIEKAANDDNTRLVLDIQKEINKLLELGKTNIDITSGGDPIKININLNGD